MTTYARIVDGKVAEIIVIDGDPPIEDRYHPDVVATCVALKGAQVQNVTEGYTYDGSSFAAPVEPTVTEPTEAEILALVQAKQAEIEALLAKITGGSAA